MERVYFNEISAKLDLHDRRSIKDWLTKRGIRIFKDIGGKRLFADRKEFFEAYSHCQAQAIPINEKALKLRSKLNYVTQVRMATEHQLKKSIHSSPKEVAIYEYLTANVK